MKKTGMNIALIAVIIVICLCCDSLLIVRYNYKNQKLQSMKTPMDIANEYMQPKYEWHWRRLEGVFSARKDSRMGRYVVGRGGDIGSAYFSKPLDENSDSVLCRTKMEGTWVEIISGYHSRDRGIGVYIQVYSEDKGYWEGRDFIMEYENGEYIPFEREGVEHIPNKAGLEEVTGMTIEEIVEIADKQEQVCEDMLYEMKETEWKRNKVWIVLGLLLVNGTGIYLIIRKSGYWTDVRHIFRFGRKGEET